MAYVISIRIYKPCIAWLKSKELSLANTCMLKEVPNPIAFFRVSLFD
tara:strand:+ start:1519 stop:1659 length:141 start_codon:yes stop_codon:yes gene_type:complete